MSYPVDSASRKQLKLQTWTFDLAEIQQDVAPEAVLEEIETKAPH